MPICLTGPQLFLVAYPIPSFAESFLRLLAEMSSQVSSQKMVLENFKIENFDKEALQKSVEAKIGESVTFDEQEATITELESISWPVASALLVKEHGRGGRIQIHEQSGNCVLTVMTGPQFDENFSIAWLEKGQNFRFYGKPSVWFFRPVCPGA